MQEEEQQRLKVEPAEMPKGTARAFRASGCSRAAHSARQQHQASLTSPATPHRVLACSKRWRGERHQALNRAAHRCTALQHRDRMGVHGGSASRALPSLLIGLAPARAPSDQLRIPPSSLPNVGSAAMGDSSTESMGGFCLNLNKSSAWARNPLMVRGFVPAEMHNHYCVNSAAQQRARAWPEPIELVGEQAHPSLGLGAQGCRSLAGRQEPHP